MPGRSQSQQSNSCCSQLTLELFQASCLWKHLGVESPQHDWAEGLPMQSFPLTCATEGYIIVALIWLDISSLSSDTGSQQEGETQSYSLTRAGRPRSTAALRWAAVKLPRSDKDMYAPAGRVATVERLQRQASHPNVDALDSLCMEWHHVMHLQWLSRDSRTPRNRDTQPLRTEPRPSAYTEPEAATDFPTAFEQPSQPRLRNTDDGRRTNSRQAGEGIPASSAICSPSKHTRHCGIRGIIFTVGQVGILDPSQFSGGLPRWMVSGLGPQHYDVATLAHGKLELGHSYRTQGQPTLNPQPSTLNPNCVCQPEAAHRMRLDISSPNFGATESPDNARVSSTTVLTCLCQVSS